MKSEIQGHGSKTLMKQMKLLSELESHLLNPSQRRENEVGRER